MSIYIISDGELVKIGFSSNVKRRLKQLQTGNPKTLKLIATFDYKPRGRITERIMERRIHYLLRQFKIRRKGEWFNFPEHDILIEIIESILSH